MKRVIVINAKDNVAVALEEVAPGEEIEADLGGQKVILTVQEAIPFGHKIALRPLAVGEPVIKYGEVIGEATQPIAPGAWVHLHNLASRRGRPA